VPRPVADGVHGTDRCLPRQTVEYLPPPPTDHGHHAGTLPDAARYAKHARPAGGGSSRDDHGSAVERSPCDFNSLPASIYSAPPPVTTRGPSARRRGRAQPAGGVGREASSSTGCRSSARPAPRSSPVDFPPALRAGSRAPVPAVREREPLVREGAGQLAGERVAGVRSVNRARPPPLRYAPPSGGRSRPRRGRDSARRGGGEYARMVNSRLGEAR
jgi:hypothetical protein